MMATEQDILDFVSELEAEPAPEGTCNTSQQR